MLSASSGVMSVVPDYFGFGHSYEQPKQNGIGDLYKQATAVVFMMSKALVESTGCTEISKQT